jgi:hypothetical protein
MANDEARHYGNAKDYVLVSGVDPATGIKIEEEVPKSEFETSEKYKDLTLESDNVREAHPAENQPAYGVTEEGQPDTSGRRRS